MTEKAGQSSGAGGSAPFGTYFRHWRSGKIYYAKDYGYKAWPFYRGK